MEYSYDQEAKVKGPFFIATASRCGVLQDHSHAARVGSIIEASSNPDSFTLLKIGDTSAVGAFHGFSPQMISG
ncbi:hypothetical protein [Sorangium sp. So ce117]|uniref:hypothetical protein n=1 Tax=Sorangium sp. So ce117 TaxID=3133277 RepID=UPI003F604B7B